MKYARDFRALSCPVILLAGLIVGAIYSAHREGLAPELVAPQGKEAVERLKQPSVHDSLQAALAAARHRIYSDEKTANAFYANNSEQQLSAYFSTDSARLTVDTFANSDNVSARGAGPAPRFAQTERSHLSLRFIGAGYGDAIRRVQGQSAISTAENRLTYTHGIERTDQATNGFLSFFGQSASANRKTEIDEWYVNTIEGIEHGFTLREPVGERSGGERLSIRLEITGDFLAEVSEGGNSIVFRGKHGGSQLTYSGLKAYDAHGIELAAAMILKESVLSLEIDDTRAAYPLTIDPTFAQQAKLTVTSQTWGFGESVAIDGNFVVVGAPFEFVAGNSSQGAAYVFSRSGTTWSQQARLLAFDGAASERFGSSVAIDGVTIVVGSLWNRTGAAYVFFFDGTWSLQQKLVASDATSFDQFGMSVSISNNTIVVGAFTDDISGKADQGSAYAFVRSGATWTQQQKLTAANGLAGDHFGADVSVDGDYVIIGAPDRNSPTATKEGAAYIFLRSGTNWVSVAMFQDNNGANNYGLGHSVSISGNTVAIASKYQVVEVWTGSLVTWSPQSIPFFFYSPITEISLNGETLAVSTISDEGGAFTEVFIRSGTSWSFQKSFQDCYRIALGGDTLVLTDVEYRQEEYRFLNSVSVVVRSGTTWSAQATLEAQASANSDEFGTSIALTTGATGAGELQHRAVVGVPGANGTQGEAWVFLSTNQTAWYLEAILRASDRAAGDRFGCSVDIDGETIVIGSFLDNVGANADQGSAYVFAYNQSNFEWEQQQKLTASDGAVADFFGRSVGISGDTVVVGADFDNVGANSDQGSAYVFTRSGVVWTQQQKLTASDGSSFDKLGFAVDIDGNTVIAGAFSDQIGSNFGQGSAYVFTRSGTVWSEQQKLTAPDGAANDSFGNAVGVNGNAVIVGAYQDDILAASDSKGSAHIFARTGSIWAHLQKLTASDGAASDFFGFDVAIDTNTLIVGASRVNTNGNGDQGAAYVFTRSLATLLWSERQRLIAADGAAGDQFGNAVAIADQVFVVGASLDDLGPVSNAGAAYVFKAIPATISWTGATSSNWQTDTNWGSSLAPSALDDANLPASGVTSEPVISDLDVIINDLTIATGRQLTIAAGRSLTVEGDLTLNGTITGTGTLIFKGTRFINNNFINSSVSVQFAGEAALQQLSGTGLFLGRATVLSGATVQLDSDHTMNGIVIDSGGALNLSHAYVLSLLGPGVALTNNGTVNGSGTVSFEGTSAQSTSGAVSFPRLTINNPAGVTLGANSESGELTLINGDLNTGVFTLTMPAHVTSTGNTDVVGNVRRTGFTTANTLTFGNPHNTIRFTSGTPPDDVTVNLVKRAPNDFINATLRTYTITPSGGSGYLANVRLHYQNTDLNGNPKPTLGLWRKGAEWVNLGATTRNPTDNWVELAGIAQFSPWVISGPDAPIACNYVVSSSSQFFTMNGGPGSINISTIAACSWTASVSNDWIMVTSEGSGNGNGVIEFEVRENFTLSARQATIALGTAIVTIVQDGGLGEDCEYSISPTFGSLPGAGGNGTINVSSSERCAWQAVASVGWITITSGGVGIGDGVVGYSVSANPNPVGRKGTITIAGKVFSVKQKAG